ncbi:MAG: hypothetical protein JXR73_11985 [Candidatus Omnitrophica bacterium]|nr:hypothetical protein [Candidatus Omnitrophota bacterium]
MKLKKHHGVRIASLALVFAFLCASTVRSEEDSSALAGLAARNLQVENVEILDSDFSGNDSLSVELAFENKVDPAPSITVSPQLDIDWGALLGGAVKGLGAGVAGAVWGKFLDAVMDDPYTQKAQYLDLRNRLNGLSDQIAKFQKDMKLDLKINDYNSRVSTLDSHYFSVMGDVEQQFEVLFSLRNLPDSSGNRSAILEQVKLVRALIHNNRENLRQGILAINAALTGKNGTTPLVQDTWSQIVDAASDFQDDYYDMKLNQYYEFKAMQVSMLNYIIEDMNIWIGVEGSNDTAASRDAYYNLVVEMLKQQDRFKPIRNVLSEGDVYHGKGIYQVSEKLWWIHYISPYYEEKSYCIDYSFFGDCRDRRYYNRWVDYTKDGLSGQHAHEVWKYKIASAGQMRKLLKNCPLGFNGVDYLKGKGFTRLQDSSVMNFNYRYIVRTRDNWEAWDIRNNGILTWNSFTFKSPLSAWDPPKREDYFLVFDASGSNGGGNPLPPNELAPVTNASVGEEFDHLPDEDADGVADAWEEIYGIPQPLDSSGNGLPDAYTVLYPEVMDDPAGDADDDGLTNLEEYEAETNPVNRDTDGDGLFDGWEWKNGLDPLDPSDAQKDYDGDGLTNLEEFESGEGQPWTKRLRGGWHCVSILQPTKDDSLLSAVDDGPFCFNPTTQEYELIYQVEDLLPGQGYFIFIKTAKHLNVKTGEMFDAGDDEEEPSTGIPYFPLFEN